LKYPSTPVRGGYPKVGVEVGPGGRNPVLSPTLYSTLYSNKGYVRVPGYRTRLTVTPGGILASPWAVSRRVQKGYGTGQREKSTSDPRSLPPKKSGPADRRRRPANPNLAGLQLRNLIHSPANEPSRHRHPSLKRLVERFGLCDTAPGGAASSGRCPIVQPTYGSSNLPTGRLGRRSLLVDDPRDPIYERRRYA